MGLLQQLLSLLLKQMIYGCVAIMMRLSHYHIDRLPDGLSSLIASWPVDMYLFETPMGETNGLDGSGLQLAWRNQLQELVVAIFDKLLSCVRLFSVFHSLWCQSIQIKRDDRQIVRWCATARRVHTCRISLLTQAVLIHGAPCSTCPYIIWCVFSSPRSGFPSCSLTKVSWMKRYRYTTRFMRDSLPFAFLFTEYIESHRGAASIPGGLQRKSPSIGCHKEHEPSSLSPMTGANWEPSTGCIHFKPQSFLCPSFTTLPWITLDANTKTQFMSWSFTIK